MPGIPGVDYPLLAEIPKTSFTCVGRAPGYYADLETACQVENKIFVNNHHEIIEIHFIYFFFVRRG